MGTISQKLEYLNTTKGKIKDSINITGANIGSSDTFRSYSTKLKDGIVDMINKGTDTAYNNFPKTTGTGTDITLNNTYNSKLKVDLKGNTHQDSYTGKNLLNLSNFNTITVNSGITLTNDTTTGKVTLNGTANVNTFITYTTQTFNTGNIVSLSANNPITNNDVSIRLYNLDNGHVTTNAVLNTINKKDEGITLNENYNGFQIRIASGTTLNNFELYPQLELGTQATTYEPYVGGTPSPNPTYPQDIEVVTGYNNIEVVGKNLFDITTATSGTFYNTNDGSIISANVWSQSEYIVVNSGEKITISSSYLEGDNSFECSEFNSSKQWIKGSQFSFNVAFKKITLDSNTKFIKIGFRNDRNIENIQVEYGNQATTYEAYQSQSYEINLGKNLYQGFSYTRITGDMTFTYYTNGSINVDGTTSDSSANSMQMSDGANHLFELKPGTYTLSGGVTNVVVQLIQYENGSVSVAASTESSTTFTITETIQVYMRININKNKTINNVTVYPQVEKNDHATPYSAYKTPIELCKIGTYQDKIYKENNKWYIHKEIGKVVLDGSESWNKSSSSTSDWLRCYCTTSSPNGSNYDLSLSNYFKYGSVGSTNDNCFQPYSDTYLGINIKITTSIGTTASALQTWLGTHNTEVYYVLSTATNTEITDTELINELNALESANSYTGVTNITAEYISGNMPFDMSASALLKE